MKEIVVEVKNLSKQYRLGQVGTGTLSHDLNRWWFKIRGKEDPYLKIGESNRKDVRGTSDYIWALRDLNFQIQKGEILGVIGGNGAGKSTLLKILSQVTAPSIGEFKAKGRISSLLEVGTGFHLELSGRDNIYLNGTILGMSKNEISEKLDEIVQFSGVERYIDTPVKRYSSGMKVRLAFAVAAHLEPDILIVDEVLAVGDIAFQEKAIGKMKEVSESGERTVILVSHDMETISRLCTRALVLNNGELIFDGKTNQAVNVYSSHMLQKASIRSLKDRKDRKGLAQITFHKIWIEDENQEEIPIAQVGKSLVICTEIKTAIPETRTVSVGIGIKDRNGIQVCLMSSWMKGHLLQIEEKKIVQFKINKITLPEGNYIVDLFMENGTMGNVIQDHLLDAFELKVLGKDFYNSGNVVENFGHKFYVDFEQDIRNSLQ